MKTYVVEIIGDDNETVEEYEIPGDEAVDRIDAERIALQRFISYRDWSARTIEVREDPPYYDPPDTFPGTVFDPWDTTFGPIMSAIQSGDFEHARYLLGNLIESEKNE